MRPPPIESAPLALGVVVVFISDASAGALGERSSVARTATRNGRTTCDFFNMACATEAASKSVPADTAEAALGADDNADDNDDDDGDEVVENDDAEADNDTGTDFGGSTGVARTRATCGASLTKSGRGFFGSKTARYGSAGDGDDGGDGFAVSGANNFPSGGVTVDLTCMRCALDGDDTMPARKNQSPECSDIDGTARTPDAHWKHTRANRGVADI